MRITKLRAGLTMVVAALSVTASALPAQAMTFVYSDRATTPSGSNYCDYTLRSSGADFSYSGSKTLTLITRGVGYNCYVHVVDGNDISHVVGYPDAPGTGASTYSFSYRIYRIRACQNGNPGACSRWLYASDWNQPTSGA